MNSRTLRLGALSAGLLSTIPVGAIGLGDMVLHSRVGEPLRAEVPINAEPGETVEARCFTLAPLDGSDLPVISAGRTKLVREGNNYRLLITGSKPVAEPIFLIGLRAGCGTATPSGDGICALRLARRNSTSGKSVKSTTKLPSEKAGSPSPARRAASTRGRDGVASAHEASPLTGARHSMFAGRLRATDNRATGAPSVGVAALPSRNQGPSAGEARPNLSGAGERVAMAVLGVKPRWSRQKRPHGPTGR